MRAIFSGQFPIEGVLVEAFGEQFRHMAAGIVN
jgi:hypothetical protein